MAIRFILKFVLMLSSWWVLFRLMHKFAEWIKIIAHLALAAVYAFSWLYGYSVAYMIYYNMELTSLSDFVGYEVWIVFTALFEYAVVFAVLHIIYSKKELRERDQLVAELQQIATQQQIANLKAQLNPHFLFNTLNSINAMASLDTGETRRMINKLSEMLRYSINSFEK
jgi:sensor histidine kinase YesM